ncbi:MAG: carboxypeptidase-like regulatory domain-containing protein [Bryobacteraceae bacterium]|nr:carboxypeptidase-like regulatory domain-containing protein [Bryobacteraceae bacterium]MCX7604107.1 carboxypeptidase-like regulatory domain-containing protein [Bryobacteraceae bacterium]
MKNARRLIALLFAASLLASAWQWTNQKKEKPRDPTIRNVSGIVTLPDGSPASGAVVQLKNLKTLQIRSFITREDGKYNFQNLSTSIDYELTATYKDLESPRRTLSVFDTRLDAVVNLKLDRKKEQSKSEEKQEEKQP